VVAETSAPAAKLATAGTTIRWWRRWRVLAAAAGFLLLLAAGALVVPRLLDGGGADAEPVSLAVLPFRNLSAGDNYFAEGLAEEILAQLARDPQFRVAGRTSSWLLKHRGSDPRDIGRRLDVDYVLEGSVRRAEDRVHIDVALVGTHDGMRLWSQAFQGSLDDIFAIQNEIGRGVAASLRRRLVNAAPVAGPLATNGEVYHLYLTARRLIRTRDPQNARTAIVLLRRAVRLDPNYAPAWSSLGEALRFDWIDPEDHSEGRRYVERALALAPDLAEAHAALGLIEGSTPRGRAHLERAVRLDPNNAEAWLWLSTARGRMFDFDGGLAAIRRAAEIDPLWERTNQVADAAWSQGFHAEALRHDQRLIATHPEESHREMARGRIAARSGDWSGFVLHFLRAAQLDSDVQFDARFRVNSVLIMLGLPFDETVFAGMEASLMVSLAKDELPPLAEFLDRLESADRYWRYTWINVMASRAFLNQGRSADLLVLYDRAFESFAVIETAEWDDAFELQAPLIAIALREGGRHAEAERILGLVGRRLAPACRRVRLPADFWVHCARIWAVRGNREAALTALERAAAMRWPDGFEPFPEWMPRPVPAEDPAFRSLRDEPRFQRIDARIRVHLARERRELQAALARRRQT
jgi:TolB-like protein